MAKSTGEDTYMYCCKMSDWSLVPFGCDNINTKPVITLFCKVTEYIESTTASKTGGLRIHIQFG